MPKHHAAKKDGTLSDTLLSLGAPKWTLSREYGKSDKPTSS